MFKKTLVASALALAAFSSNAAVNAITGVEVSQEGAAGQASIAVPNAVVTLAAEYAVGDEVTFTVSGAQFDVTNSAPSLVVGFDAGQPNNGGDEAATAGILNVSATSVTFRISAQDAGAAAGISYVGGTLTLSGMVLTTSTVLDATGKIDVTYGAVTGLSNTPIDTAGTLTDTAVTVVAQYAATTTKPLNGIIDVNNDRQQFTAGNDTTTTDVLVVTPTDAAPAVHPGVYTGATYVIKGDFSWMETDGDAGIDAGELTAAFGVANGSDDTFASTINADATEITVVATDGGGNDVEAATFTFTVAGKGDDSAVLEVQDFTVDTTLNFNTAAAVATTKALQTDASAGSWTLNGAQAFYNYVPVGFSGLQNNLVFSNSGIKDGEVVIEAFDTDGNDYGPVTITDMLMGGTNMTLTSPMIQNYLSVPSGTRLSVTVTINAPDNDVKFSGYTQKAGTGRQIIPVVEL